MNKMWPTSGKLRGMLGLLTFLGGAGAGGAAGGYTGAHLAGGLFDALSPPTPAPAAPPGLLDKLKNMDPDTLKLIFAGGAGVTALGAGAHYLRSKKRKEEEEQTTV